MTNKDKILRYLECGLKVQFTGPFTTKTIVATTEYEGKTSFVFFEEGRYPEVLPIDYFEDCNYTLTPIPLKPNYKPGDLVTILPIARESDGYNDWCQEKKDMIDLGTYEIQDESNGICWVYNKDKSEYFYFPAWAVAPAFADEVAEIEKAEKLKILCELEARMEQIKKEIEALKN